MSETRFPTLTAEEMTDEQRAVVESIQSGPRGAGLRGPFNALLRSPVLCDLVQRVGAYVRFGTSLPAPLNELAICMAGRKWGAQYEFYAHRRLGIDAGLNPAILDAVAVGQRPADMSSDETIVYEFVTDLLSTGQVSDAPLWRRHGSVWRTRRHGYGRCRRLLQPGVDGAERGPRPAAGRRNPAAEAALSPESRPGGLRAADCR